METIVPLPAAVAAPVPAPGSAHDQLPATRPVQTHQVLAVVCALVCFAPLGIAAVVQAGNVRTQLALGDLEGARRASRMALRLCCASAMASLFFLLVVVVGVVT